LVSWFVFWDKTKFAFVVKEDANEFSVIDRKIAVAGDACSRPRVIIRFHDLLGEIDFYHKRD